MAIFLSIILAYIYGHVAEYYLHILLHKFGTKKSSPLSFHFSEHHRIARKSKFSDPVYQGTIFKWNASGKEVVGLILILILHFPIFFYYPFFYVTLVFSAAEYYYKHRKAHLNPEWAKKNIPWHYEHHMGKNQHLNWGVRSNVVDIILSTNN